MKPFKMPKLVIVLACAVSLSGCSFFMKRVPSEYRDTDNPDCTDSMIVPVVDLIESLSAVGYGAMNLSGYKELSYVYFGLAAVYAVATGYGFYTSSRCREAREKHEARFRDLLAQGGAPPTQLLSAPAPIAPPAAPEGAREERSAYDPMRVLGVLRQHEPEIQACIRQQAEADPALKGRLTLVFKVAGDGSVIGFEVTAPEFGGTPVAECVRKLIEGLQFPPFSGQPHGVPFWIEVK